jgi:hypothetical protein
MEIQEDQKVLSMHGLLSDHFLRKFTLWYKPQNTPQKAENGNKKTEEKQKKQGSRVNHPQDGNDGNSLIDGLVKNSEK